MNKLITGAIAMTTAIAANAVELMQDWDKTFPKSDKVEHAKATFRNRFGITLAADVYKPKGATGRLAAIAVSGPFGAVKEQSSGLYAQTLAERGFLTVAFDPSFTGESGGEPRYVASPDINTEDFQAAVDYLISRDDVDAGKIGILGICGWGGLAINAAAVDTNSGPRWPRSSMTPRRWLPSVSGSPVHATTSCSRTATATMSWSRDASTPPSPTPFAPGRSCSPRPSRWSTSAEWSKPRESDC